MIRLVKFECGCVGFIVPGELTGQPLSWVVKPCDLSAGECDRGIVIELRKRPGLLDPKPKYHPEDPDDPCKERDLKPDEIAELFHQIGGLIADGYRFRQLQYTLGILGLSKKI